MFGTIKIGDSEQNILRVKSVDEMTLPSDTYLSTIDQDQEMIVRHDFKIDRLYKKSVDGNGCHYAWYILSFHYMFVDNTPKVKAEIEHVKAEFDYACMMLDVSIPKASSDETDEEM